MRPELYFDISSEESGGSLFRISKEQGPPSFLFSHSTYDDDIDELKTFETPYPDFQTFWSEITRNKEWFYLHPLFVHPEQRAFIREQLKGVDWSIYPDKKWQESHQRQWKKVLSDPADYYQPGPQTKAP